MNKPFRDRIKTKIENLWVIVTDFNLNMCRNLSFKHPDFS